MTAGDSKLRPAITGPEALIKSRYLQVVNMSLDGTISSAQIQYMGQSELQLPIYNHLGGLFDSRNYRIIIKVSSHDFSITMDDHIKMAIEIFVFEKLGINQLYQDVALCASHKIWHQVEFHTNK
jgi:hypothetical protein